MVDTHTPVEPVDLTPWTAGLIPPPSSGFPEGFVRQAFNWFCVLRWFSGRSPGPVPDISWVEFFMFWVVVCGFLPPFRVDGCVPRRAVSCVLRSGNLLPGVAVSSYVSANLLRARMALPGLS